MELDFFARAFDDDDDDDDDESDHSSKSSALPFGLIQSLPCSPSSSLADSPSESTRLWIVPSSGSHISQESENTCGPLALPYQVLQEANKQTQAFNQLYFHLEKYEISCSSSLNFVLPTKVSDLFRHIINDFFQFEACQKKAASPRSDFFHSKKMVFATYSKCGKGPTCLRIFVG